MTWLAEAAMLSNGWRRFLMLVTAGAIGALSVPPFYFLPVLFFTMPIWVWCLDGAERLPGWRKIVSPAFTIGFAFGLGYFLVAFHWLGAAFLVEGGIMVGLMPFAILALAGLIALFWGIASALAHLLWTGGAMRIVTLAVFLAAAEWARGHFFSGFPFDLLGYALAFNDPISQSASVVGVYGLTLLVALLSFTPALIWPADQCNLARRLAPLVLALIVMGGQFAWGQYRLETTKITPRTDMKMRLVQPMILDHADWAAAKPAAIITKLINLSEMHTGPNDPGLSDITQIVWPESSLPFYFSQYPEALSRIGKMLPAKTILLTGAAQQQYDPDIAPGAPLPAYNALLAIDHAGEIIASYDKIHLVPFGEYLPFPGFFAMLGLRQFVPGANGWQPGTRPRLMAVPGTPAFLALICYEAAFSGDLGRGVKDAQFILNITNDAWFDGSIGPAQHADMARLRAVEQGLPMVRVGNSGVTMLVDPLGRVTARLAPETTNVLDVIPAHRLAGTLFTRLGYWPFWIAELVGLGMTGLGVARARRQRA